MALDYALTVPSMLRVLDREIRIQGFGFGLSLWDVGVIVKARGPGVQGLGWGNSDQPLL